jgi:hypothetical protein
MSINWDAPITHRVKYEDHDDEPFGDHDAFTSAREAFRHYRAVIAEPDPELGSVYVTELDDHDEHIIASHRFGGEARS